MSLGRDGRSIASQTKRAPPIQDARPSARVTSQGSDEMAARNGVKEDAQPGAILLVVHDFVARSADELSLAKGDRIELIERDDDFGDGWFLGRHLGNGNTGLFPEGAHERATMVRAGVGEQPGSQRHGADH